MGAADKYALPERQAALLRSLARHSPADPKEARDILLIRRLVCQHSDIMSPRCQVGHITASALVIDCASGRILLHYHRKLSRWLQVGGHLEGEVEVAQAALREAREETGLPDLAFFPHAAAVPVDLDVHTIPAQPNMPAHLHLDFRYLLTTRQPQALAPQPGESLQFRWLTVQQALALDDALDSSLRRLLRKAQAAIAQLG